MYVGIDKATAVRMYDLVTVEWQRHLAELRGRVARVPVLERAGLQAQIAFMEETDMAVVVSQSQNEIADLREWGSTSRPTAGGCSTRTSMSASRIPTTASGSCSSARCG